MYCEVCGYVLEEWELSEFLTNGISECPNCGEQLIEISEQGVTF